jgi:uncharacterized SAM-binding protein YcdF (DUF218 family)
MFVLKKIIGALLSPGVIILVLLVLGLVRMTFSKKSGQSGRFLVFLALLSFYFFTTAPLPQALLYPLENRYKPIHQVNDLGKIDYIVVLSGGNIGNLDVPPTGQLKAVTALRVVEAIRLFHLFSEQPTLVMSGGGNPSDGETMAAFAQSLGIPADKLVAETESMDTHGNAYEVKRIIKDSPFLLVTSGWHMPRSRLIFNHLDMRPIPAPAHFMVKGTFSWDDFIPSGLSLDEMWIAVHEYLGLAYLKLFPGQAGK